MQKYKVLLADSSIQKPRKGILEQYRISSEIDKFSCSTSILIVGLKTLASIGTSNKEWYASSRREYISDLSYKIGSF
jgi:hypothetical protein